VTAPLLPPLLPLPPLPLLPLLLLPLPPLPLLPLLLLPPPPLLLLACGHGVSFPQRSWQPPRCPPPPFPHALQCTSGRVLWDSAGLTSCSCPYDPEVLQ